ncbi:hypothetical protein GCM10011574_71570 [Microbispora bryophytorum]|uniref:Uncharacterized protein n=1 Tax=Microbispora bryophytorum TaxID=1460882 RepID=A0A8H9HBN8_9ACTN|nr:hypothetical protein GCM10011574_71570 [Microbispora bryophytorum]
MAVTVEPDWLWVALQIWVTCSPAPKDQVSCQPLTASPRLLMVTLALNPPGQLELMA